MGFGDIKMNVSVTTLKAQDYPKCSNIWDMSKNRILADKFYNEILSGNRVTFVYSINSEYIAEISMVYDMHDSDYTIPNKRVYVSRLIVKPEFRRQGIGRELIGFIKNKAKEKGFSELSIGVDLDNYPALKLYITSGFNQIVRIDEDGQGKFVKLLCVL